MNVTEIQKELFRNQDREYGNFQAKLVPTLEPQAVIGVRAPILRGFATALGKQYEAILPFLENKYLETWTHNKAIQKALESYRISDEQKKYLRTLKI